MSGTGRRFVTGWGGVFMVWLAMGMMPAAQGGEGVPQMIEYRGTLFTDLRHESPLEAGTYDVTIRLYSQERLKERIYLLWEEYQRITVGDGGVFSVTLGEGLPGSRTNTLRQAIARGGDKVFLEFETVIDGEALTFSPRQRLLTVPYALVADNASYIPGMFAVMGDLTVSGCGKVRHVTVGEDALVKEKLSTPIAYADELVGFDGIGNKLLTWTTIEVKKGMQLRGEVTTDGAAKLLGSTAKLADWLAEVSVDDHHWYESETDAFLFLSSRDGGESSYEATVVVNYDGRSEPQPTDPAATGDGTSSEVYTVTHHTRYPIPVPAGSVVAVYIETRSEWLVLDGSQENAVCTYQWVPFGFN